MESYFHVGLNVSLLKEEDKINRALRAHLDQCGPDIEVLDAMDRALADLRDLNGELIPVLYPLLYDAAVLVDETEQTLKRTVSDDHSCFLTVFPEKGEPLGKTLTHFPLVGETVAFAADLLRKVTTNRG